MTCNRPTMFRSFARSFVVILKYGFRSSQHGCSVHILVRTRCNKDSGPLHRNETRGGRYQKRLAQDRELASRAHHRLRIMYLESNGLWTGVDWDGESVGFFALGETDESGATKKLIAIRPRMLGG